MKRKNWAWQEKHPKVLEPLTPKQKKTLMSIDSMRFGESNASITSLCFKQNGVWRQIG